MLSFVFIILLQVNYFSADKDERPIWRVFIKEKVCMQNLCLYAEFDIIELRIFPNDSLHISLIESFIDKSLLVQDPNMVFSKNKWFENVV